MYTVHFLQLFAKLYTTKGYRYQLSAQSNSPHHRAFSGTYQLAAAITHHNSLVFSLYSINL